MQSVIGKPGLLIHDLLGRRLIKKHGCYFLSVVSLRADAMTACIHGLRRDRSPENDGLRARARDWQPFSQASSSPLSSISLYLDVLHSADYFSTWSASIYLMWVTGCLWARCTFLCPTWKSMALLQRFYFTPYSLWEQPDRNRFLKEIKSFFFFFPVVY